MIICLIKYIKIAKKVLKKDKKEKIKKELI